MYVCYIVGLEFGLPTGPNAVTPQWLTAVLRKSGALPNEGVVSDVNTERFSGGGLICSSYKVKVSYENHKRAGPARLFMKMPLDVPKQRALVEAFDVYSKEALWYRDIAPNSLVHTPEVYAAIVNEEKTDYCLLLQDLSHFQQRDRKKGLSYEDGLKVVDMLAAYHSKWTDRNETLEKLRNVFYGFDHSIYVDGLPKIHDSGWKSARLHVQQMSEEARTFGDEWKSFLPLLINHMNKGPLTLSHGDPKMENLFFDDLRNRILIIDPQLSGVTNIALDIAIIVGFSLEAAQYRGRTNQILQRYIDTSLQHGIYLNLDKLVSDMKVALGFCFYYGFASFGSFNDYSDAMKLSTITYMRRISDAMTEFDVLNHLRQLRGY